jgi:hypothetical protein
MSHPTLNQRHKNWVEQGKGGIYPPVVTKELVPEPVEEIVKPIKSERLFKKTKSKSKSPKAS